VLDASLRSIDAVVFAYDDVLRVVMLGVEFAARVFHDAAEVHRWIVNVSSMQRLLRSDSRITRSRFALELSMFARCLQKATPLRRFKHCRNALEFAPQSLRE